MAHNRKYVPGVVELVKARTHKSWPLHGELHDTVESLVIESGMLEGAPFKWIGLIYLYGKDNCATPDYDPIDKKDGELPIRVWVPMEFVVWCQNEEKLGLLRDILLCYALEALLHIGQKYKLKVDLIQQERDKYPEIPQTLEALKSLAGERS